MKRGVKDVMMTIIGGVAGLYLLNPSFGVFEILSDNLPLVGNIDEAMATTVLVGVLGYFGITIPRIFQRSPRPQDDVRPVKDAAVD